LKISIIIPALNEQESIVKLLDRIAGYREQGHEIILVDGGSTDNTMRLASNKVDQILVSAPGRAMQMNFGAQRASGEILWFLHADSLPYSGAVEYINQALQRDPRCWGRFDVRLSGRHILFRVIESLMNWRSRYTGIATGDQAMFVQRTVFEQVGGFPQIPLMEDIALSKRLLRLHKPVCLRTRVLTSSRRWHEKGIIATVVLMWCLRLGYFIGISPWRLHQWYYR
jgi:rSAM/selenodomain-associated transferase 2